MYRRPSFMNPFARQVKVDEDVLHASDVDPLDPGPSRRPARRARPGSTSHRSSSRFQDPLPVWGNFLDLHTSGPSRGKTVVATPTSVPTHGSSPRTYQSVAVQTEAIDVVVGEASSRKGSLSKLRDAGKDLLLRRFIRLLKSKRGSALVKQAWRREAAPQASGRPVPPRPARPESLDLSFLEYAFNGVAPAPASAILPPVHPTHSAANGMVVATEAAGTMEASARAETVGEPQSLQPSPTPLTRPCFVMPSPRTVALDQGREGPSTPALIGACLSKPTYAPLTSSYWSVTQRNNLRIPPLSVSKWITGGILGSGGFARVYLVYNVSVGAECAMKVVHYGKGISTSACRGLVSELQVLSLLGSEPQPAPFLLQPLLSDSLWAWRSSRGCLHIVTEPCAGGTLASYKKRLPFRSLVLVCAEVILGLRHLHRHGIVHHDLKPSNVLVNAAGHCVIADYGGARFMETRHGKGTLVHDSDSSPIMTTPFAAPEVIACGEDGAAKEYDERADYWSLGATAVSMIMDDEFLPGTTDMKFMEYRVRRIQTQMLKQDIPLEVQTFVLDLLQMDPAKRPIYPEIAEHWFFGDTDWDEVLAQKRPAIPIVKGFVASARGWTYETPKVHGTKGDTADFLAELRAAKLTLTIDDSYDVEEHHAAISADI